MLRKGLMLLCLATCFLVLATAYAQESQGVEVGGVVYDHVDPGEPFTEAPRPPQPWASPVPQQAEKEAGMIPFVTPDPGDYRPYRRPKPEERVDRLSAFLTPGEDEPVWVGVWALNALKGLRAEVSLPGAPISIDIRHLHCWPQRTGWRSRQFYITPELILPCGGGRKTVPVRRGLLEEQPFDVPAGETAAFWFTLTAREDARPGTYEGTVRISASGRQPLALPLFVEVLPFRLDRPVDRYWLLYADVFRWEWGKLSDEQILAELRDFARHGMTGLVEMRLGTPDLTGLREGRVEFDASAYKRLAELCQRAGLPGPHVCSYGIAYQVMEALGVQCDLMKDVWPLEIRQGVAAVARAAVEATRGLPRWYYYGWDEPSGDNTYAIQDYQAWHDGGALTYATFYAPGFLEKAKDYLTAPCFAVGMVSTEEMARAAREACENTGAEFWWYGTGSYVNPYPQECGLFYNRYGAGFLFWKTGAKAQVSWTFCRPHEDVFNDFDGSQANSGEPKEQATAYPHLLRPDDWSTYQGAIPTLAWEGLREGWDDYRYLFTLSQLIAQGRASRNREVRRAAREAQEKLDALVEGIPWANPMLPAAFPTDLMQKARRAVADEIVNLHDLMAGRRQRRAPQREAKVTLIVRTVAADDVNPFSLPALAAGTAATPPRLDGVLDDPCWAQAPAASHFVGYDDGKAAPVQTLARVCQDDKALYVAFECAEPRMDGLVARHTGRDAYEVWLDDGVELFLAGPTRRPYVHVIVNAAGALYDEVNMDAAWDADIKAAVSKRSDSWSVEMALPWRELETAGVRRAPVMTVNFCRNRFAELQPGVSPHTTWSCTYGNFHAPERFGFLQLSSGPVVFSRVTVPGYWGPQEMELVLSNRSANERLAWVRFAGKRQARTISPTDETSFVFPLYFSRPGPNSLTLTYGAQGTSEQQLPLAIPVPHPLSLVRWPSLIEDGQQAALVVKLGTWPDGVCSLRLHTTVSDQASRYQLSMAAQAGRLRRVDLTLRGLATICVELVGADGRAVVPPVQRRVVVLGGVR